jgi:hypothetical protein
MCLVTISPTLTIVHSDGVLISIEIRGGVTDCNQVLVTIQCDGGAPVSKTATLDTPLTWIVNFSSTELLGAGCKCDGRITVKAECVGVPGCKTGNGVRLDFATAAFSATTASA